MSQEDKHKNNSIDSHQNIKENISLLEEISSLNIKEESSTVHKKKEKDNKEESRVLEKQTLKEKEESHSIKKEEEENKTKITVKTENYTTTTVLLPTPKLEEPKLERKQPFESNVALIENALGIEPKMIMENGKEASMLLDTIIETLGLSGPNMDADKFLEKVLLEESVEMDVSKFENKNENDIPRSFMANRILQEASIRKKESIYPISSDSEKKESPFSAEQDVNNIISSSSSLLDSWSVISSTSPSIMGENDNIDIEKILADMG